VKSSSLKSRPSVPALRIPPMSLCLPELGVDPTTPIRGAVFAGARIPPLISLPVALCLPEPGYLYLSSLCCEITKTRPCEHLQDQEQQVAGGDWSVLVFGHLLMPRTRCAKCSVTPKTKHTPPPPQPSLGIPPQRQVQTNKPAFASGLNQAGILIPSSQWVLPRARSHQPW